MNRDKLIRLMFAEQNCLIAYAWSIVRDEHVAEDLYQDISIAALEKADQIIDLVHLRKWARKSVRFAALNHLRADHRNPVIFTEDLQDLLDRTWEEVATDSEMLEALQACMGELTDRNRNILKMRYVEGMSGIDVAQKLGRPPHTVYKAMSRIYQQLGRCINKRMDTENVHG